MWKKRILCLVLVLCTAVLLTACQQKEREVFPEEAPTPTPALTPEPARESQAAPQSQTDSSASSQIDFDNPEYNPAAEEGGQDEEIILVVTAAPATPAPTMNSEYAGATPVVIDPIDKPTPTPVPKVTFSYTTYDVNALHLSFQGPTGWVTDDSQTDTFTLTNPDQSMDFPAQITIRVLPLNKDYSEKELTKEVKGAVETLRSTLGFSKFDPSNTATHHFLRTQNSKGKYEFIKNKAVYMSFTGTLKEGGVKVAGRVIVNCYNKTLYIMTCIYPGRDSDLRNTYEDVYRKVRDTLNIVP